jgi:hypothetical protein
MPKEEEVKENLKENLRDTCRGQEGHCFSLFPDKVRK